MFFWKLSYKSMFPLKQACGRCFAENRQWCFLELPGKRACDALLERTDSWENVWCLERDKHPTNSGQHCVALVFLATLCWPLLGFAGTGLLWLCCVALVHLATLCWSLFVWLHRERETHQRSSGGVLVDLVWLAEFCSFFWINLLLLTHEWCLRVDWAASAGSSELNCWYPDIEGRIRTKELLLNRSTPSFALLTFLFHYLWWAVG